MKIIFLKKIAIALALIISFSSCDNDDNDSTTVLPVVNSSTTSQNVEVNYTTIKISGKVTSEGGSAITARGVCWSTSPNPTILDNKNNESSNNFNSIISGLTANTTYYFRVYASNAAGTSYGESQTFSTSSLANTTWDFTILFDNTTTWHADVTFNADGTTIYDEPDNPGVFTTYGTWTLNGNTLSYDMDSSSNSSSYQYTGTLLGNTMSGTFTFGNQPLKNWTAIEY